MGRLIDADKFREEWLENGENEYVYDTNAFLESIDEQPTVESVPKSYSDQIRWERDIAIEQLNEIGCQFGQKMDDVKKKLEAEPAVHGEWIDGGCSNCGAYIPTDSFWDYISEKECEFCYSCGAKMDGGVSDD